MLSVKAVTLIFIPVSGRVSAISSAKQGKSGSIYNLVCVGRAKCVHFMKNSHLLALKAHTHKMNVFVVH